MQSKRIHRTTVQRDAKKLFSKWLPFDMCCAWSGEGFQSYHLAAVRGFSAVKNSDIEIAHREFAGFFFCDQKRLLGVPHCRKTHFGGDCLTLALPKEQKSSSRIITAVCLNAKYAFLAVDVSSFCQNWCYFWDSLTYLDAFGAVFLPCLFVQFFALPVWYPRARYLWFALCSFLILRGWNISMQPLGRRARPEYFKIFRVWNRCGRLLRFGKWSPPSDSGWFRWGPCCYTCFFGGLVRMKRVVHNNAQDGRESTWTRTLETSMFVALLFWRLEGS